MDGHSRPRHALRRDTWRVTGRTAVSRLVWVLVLAVAAGHQGSAHLRSQQNRRRQAQAPLEPAMRTYETVEADSATATGVDNGAYAAVGTSSGDGGALSAAMAAAAAARSSAQVILDDAPAIQDELRRFKNQPEYAVQQQQQQQQQRAQSDTDFDAFRFASKRSQSEKQSRGMAGEGKAGQKTGTKGDDDVPDYLKKPPWWLPTPPEWGPVPSYIFTSYYAVPPAHHLYPYHGGYGHPNGYPYWSHTHPDLFPKPPPGTQTSTTQKTEEPKEDSSLPKWLQKPIWWTTSPGPHPGHAYQSSLYNPATLPQPAYNPVVHVGMLGSSTYAPTSQYPVWYGSPHHDYWGYAPGYHHPLTGVAPHIWYGGGYVHPSVSG